MENIISTISNYIPKIGIVDFIEILIMVFVLYKILVLIKNTKAWIFLKGILILIGFYIFSDILGFHAIKMIFESLFSAILILLIVVFQQELKKILGEIGKKGNILQFKLKKEKQYEKLISDEHIDAIVAAVDDMSKVKTGALILIERDLPLKEYSDTGIKVNADISKQMLIQIFEKNTPLHDGAVIINNDEIESATCYLPLSHNEKINKSLGTRHRAAIGISEVSDCFTIVVSEETGKISTVLNGKLSHGITLEELRKQLEDIQSTKMEIKSRDSIKKNWKIKIFSAIAAFALWVVLINSTDPVIQKTISNVNVSVINENKITDEGMSYQIIDGENIDVTVSGKKSIIDNISQDNISAYADFNDLSITNATEIIANCNVDGVDVTPKQKMMNISIEDTKEVDYDITINQIGTLSSNNYINSIELDKKSIKISGPISKIDVIGNVVANVDITNTEDNSIIETTPIIYDKNGQEMDTSDLTMNIEKLNATIHMYKTKVVPLTISLENKGYNGEIVSYDYDKEEITIAADDLTLDTIDGIFVEIPIDIDSSVKTSDFIKIINLNDFLQKGVYLAEKDNKLSINVSYEQYIEKNIDILPESIEIVGQSRKYTYSILEPITVKIKGLAKDIENIQLTSFVDVSDKKAGTYTVDLQIDSKNVVGTYKATIEIGLIVK